MKACVALLGVVVAMLFISTIADAAPKAVLVFGDSLSDGFMLKRSEAYPALLAKKLRAAGLNFQ